MKNKGLSGLAGALIGIMIAVVIGTSVTINVVYQQLDAGTTCATGTALTVLNLLPVMIAVVLLVAIVSLARM